MNIRSFDYVSIVLCHREITTEDNQEENNSLTSIRACFASNLGMPYKGNLGNNWNIPEILSDRAHDLTIVVYTKVYEILGANIVSADAV